MLEARPWYQSIVPAHGAPKLVGMAKLPDDVRFLIDFVYESALCHVALPRTVPRLRVHQITLCANERGLSTRAMSTARAAIQRSSDLAATITTPQPPQYPCYHSASAGAVKARQKRMADKLHVDLSQAAHTAATATSTPHLILGGTGTRTTKEPQIVIGLCTCKSSMRQLTSGTDSKWRGDHICCSALSIPSMLNGPCLPDAETGCGRSWNSRGSEPWADCGQWHDRPSTASMTER